MKRSVFLVLSFCALALAGSSARAGNGDVSIRSGGNEYHPDTIHVQVGDTVTWTNNDRTLLQTNHTVTADDGSFDSGTIRERASFQQTFTAPGSFTYHFTIHAGMSGTVVVHRRPSRTPTPTPPPTTSAPATPKPSKSRAPTPSPSASSSTSTAPSIDPSGAGGIPSS